MPCSTPVQLSNTWATTNFSRVASFNFLRLLMISKLYHDDDCTLAGASGTVKCVLDLISVMGTSL